MNADAHAGQNISGEQEANPTSQMAERMEKFKRYYETLLANYHAIGQQLQHAELHSPEVIVRLQEKRKEIARNIQLFLAKCSSLRSNTQPAPVHQETVLADKPLASVNNFVPAKASEVENEPCRAIFKRQTSLTTLLHSIDPNADLDDDARQFLLNVADNFLSSVATFSSMLAKSRNATCLSRKDIQLTLERCHSIRESKSFVSYKNHRAGTEGHRQRLQQVKKAATALNLKNLSSNSDNKQE